MTRYQGVYVSSQRRTYDIRSDRLAVAEDLLSAPLAHLSFIYDYGIDHPSGPSGVMNVPGLGSNSDTVRHVSADLQTNLPFQIQDDDFCHLLDL